MEIAVKRANGFTLIELMVVLTIIVIIATASVPQIQLWIARNRGMTAVAQIISDFSKTKSIAAYSVNANTDNLSASGNLVRTRPETAMMFRRSSYSILQRTVSTKAWHEVESDSPLKKTALPLRVEIKFVNAEEPTDNPGNSPTLIFTSTGRTKKIDNSLVLPGADAGDLECGDINSPLNGRRIFVARIRSAVDDSRFLWYQIEIDTSGESFICMVTVTGEATTPDFSAETANIVEL